MKDIVVYLLQGGDKSVYSKLMDYNFKNIDIATIFVGTNDFKLNKPIYGKDSINTFSYCYDNLIRKIKNDNPSIKIYLLTPIARNNAGYTSSSSNTLGLTLSDYRECVILTAKKHNIETIDLFNESGINDSNLSKYTFDGLHPNNLGYIEIGKTLSRKIIFN